MIKNADIIFGLQEGVVHESGTHDELKLKLKRKWDIFVKWNKKGNGNVLQNENEIQMWIRAH